MHNKIELYSARQVSPFIGNIQVIQADFCRAISSDGINWQIQASCETHQQIWGIAKDEYVPRRYVLYGSWNKTNQFSSLPLDPMLDVPGLDHIQNTLIDTLNSNHLQLPLPQKDFYECWLLDSQSQYPLVLLATATDQAMIPHIQINSWQAMAQQDTSSITGPHQDKIQQLESHINSQGVNPTWFSRQSKNHSINLATNNSIDNKLFPELLINKTLLPNTLHNPYKLLINWLSPRLLTLNALNSDTREHIEQMAQYHAVETRKRLAIYPQPLSTNILNKIMVELKLRDL